MVIRATRYDIQRPVEYRVKMSPGSGPLQGSGRTLNISRKGLLFQAERELGVGKKIDVVIQMGASLGESAAEINLHIQGITVRCEKLRTAVAIKKYRLKPVRSSD